LGNRAFLKSLDGEFEIALTVIVKLLILRQDLIGSLKRGEVDGAIFG